MYPASAAFHTAVANGNDQIAMLLFFFFFFTNADLRVDNGIELNEYFNTEEDLCIGQTPSSELTFTIFNDRQSLNNYEFGEFIATIGVQINSTTEIQTERLRADSGSNSWRVSLDGTTLTRNGTAVGTQPAQEVICILIYDGKVYCFGRNNYSIVYNDSDGSVANVTVNSYMKSKGASLEGYGAYYNNTTRLLKLYTGDKIRTFEFVPLGVFRADRPNVPTKIEIDFTCYDRMQKFEKDMPSASALGITYPTTIGTLFTKMCQYVGVPYLTNSFINSDATIAAEPEAFGTATMRQVMGWIAEAAGSNARFDRDGNLKMAWLNTNTGQILDEGKYSEFDPYWYQTQTVTKLYNRSTGDGTDTTYGNGTAGYLIQDNPLLKGVT